jgi:ribosomal protein L24
MKKSKIKTGSSVKVICGKYRNSVDIVKKVEKKNSLVYLENSRRVKFIKNSKNTEEKTKEIFVPINVSNVVL